MFFQLVRGVKFFPALQAPNLISTGIGLLVSPAARVLLVLLKILLFGKLPQTRHTVNAVGLALVLVVQFGQAEVALATYACVWQ